MVPPWPFSTSSASASRRMPRVKRREAGASLSEKLRSLGLPPRSAPLQAGSPKGGRFSREARFPLGEAPALALLGKAPRRENPCKPRFPPMALLPLPCRISFPSRLPSPKPLRSLAEASPSVTESCQHSANRRLSEGRWRVARSAKRQSPIAGASPRERARHPASSGFPEEHCAHRRPWRRRVSGVECGVSNVRCRASGRRVLGGVCCVLSVWGRPLGVGCWGSAVGRRALDVRVWVLCVVCWVLGVGCWVQGVRCSVLGAGCRLSRVGGREMGSPRLERQLSQAVLAGGPLPR
jgi:hypothetical protein